MRSIYVRQSSNNNTTGRQDYLTSTIRQEHLLAFKKLDLKEDFKNKSKELIIELPNELVGENYNEILNKYIDRFKQENNYENVAGAIHLNKSKSNLHMHLIYIDRTFTKIENNYKKDTYLYTSGKRLKKNDYNENNPQHISIKAGKPKLDFSKIEASKLEEYLKKLKDNDTPNKEKFDIRRLIIAESNSPYIEKWSNCLESNISSIEDKKKITKKYKDIFTNLNNQELKKRGLEEKYRLFSEFEELGYVPLKKIGKVINNKPNKIQEKIIKYNDLVSEHNEKVSEIIESEYSFTEKKNIIKELKKIKNNDTEKSSFKFVNFNNLLERVQLSIAYLIEKMEKIYEQKNTNANDGNRNGEKNRKVSNRSKDIERKNNRTYEMEM